jgi:TPR repeat protein
LYSSLTGVPYFVDSEVPTAVFLGLHLLVTDPSTSPRTPPGKLLFGVLYGLGVFVLYGLLGTVGAPTFYDKLLSVPLLNLSVRGIERIVRALQDAPLARLLPKWEPARANLAHIAVWAAFFGLMASVGATDATHRGDTVPFWERACAEGRRNACERLLSIESTYCGDNSGWACNELGRHYVEGKVASADFELALGYFSRACELRFQAGCVNLLAPESLSRTNPRPLDLRLLLREGGTNLMEMKERELYIRACDHGWNFACPTALGDGPPRKTSK